MSRQGTGRVRGACLRALAVGARWRLALCVCALTVYGAGTAQAAKIGDLHTVDWAAQAARFLSFEDSAVRMALAGTVLLGLVCGLLGSFVVVRRLSLFGDALSHAVLPGVALGFLWNMTKDPFAILVGATVAGVLGVVVVSLIRDTTTIKEDAAMGMVLAGFYGAGTCLMTMIQGLPVGTKSGLDKIFFGQAAALSVQDVSLIGAVTVAALLLVSLFYKELVVLAFDNGFARSSGLPARCLHYALMLLLSFAVVVSLQAVGVVLVSAMLITPAASAYLLTDRFPVMLVLASAFGMVSGAAGVFLSFVGNNLPTGPLIVLAAASVFCAAFFFGPRHGLLPRWWRQRSRSARIRLENTLKSIYQVREAGGFAEEGVSLEALAGRRSESLAEAHRQALALERAGFATLTGGPAGALAAIAVHLTPRGWERACQIVRNHRLWELYLTNAAHFPADHVHDDAEIIEHVLGEETVARLEKRLNYPNLDPHGRRIPGDRERGGEGPAPERPMPRTPGY